MLKTTINKITKKILEKYPDISDKPKAGGVSLYVDDRKLLQISEASKDRIEFLILRDPDKDYCKPEYNKLDIRNIRKYDPSQASYIRPWGYMFYRILIVPEEFESNIDFINFIIERSYQIARDGKILKVSKDEHEKLAPIFNGSYLFEQKVVKEEVAKKVVEKKVVEKVVKKEVIEEVKEINEEQIIKENKEEIEELKEELKDLEEEKIIKENKQEIEELKEELEDLGKDLKNNNTNPVAGISKTWILCALIIGIIVLIGLFLNKDKMGLDDYKDATNKIINNDNIKKSQNTIKGKPNDWLLGENIWINKGRNPSSYVREMHKDIIHLNEMVKKNKPIDEIYNYFKNNLRSEYNSFINTSDESYKPKNNEEKDWGNVIKNFWLKYNPLYNEDKSKNFLKNIEGNKEILDNEHDFTKYTFKSAKKALNETPFLADKQITNWMNRANEKAQKNEKGYYDACFNYYENNLDKILEKIDSQLQKGKKELAKTTARSQGIYKNNNGKINIPQLECISYAYSNIDNSYNEKAAEAIINTRAVCDSLIKIFEGEIDFFVGTVDIEKDIPKTATKNKDAIAVIFGIEKYKNVSDVTYASRDAHFIAEYFENMLGIPSENIYLRKNSDVTKGEFDKLFSKGGWLSKRIIKGKTDIYFYYAGHGAPDIKEKTGYLIPYDGDPNYPSQTGYSIELLNEKINNLGAKSNTIFLDACFSGANRESDILLAGARPVFIDVKKPSSKNGTMFSASSGSEISSSWPEKKHGIFSYYLMKGFRGYADKNNDGKLTLKELGNYINENVSSTASKLDREQNPTFNTSIKNRTIIEY